MIENMINSFRDKYFFLSNFYSCKVTYQGLTYENNEAAFQAQKCLSDGEKRKFCSLNPSEAKRLGRHVPLRKDWENVKVGVMKEIVRCKFEQHPELKEKLLALKNIYLEEGNDWGDKIWGTVNGQGKNLLGNILMSVRDEFLALEKEKEIEM